MTQGIADVETLGGAVPSSLFLLTIAKSGERKTSCDKLVMAAINEHRHVAMQKHREELERYEQELDFLSRKTKIASDKAAKSGKNLSDLNDALPQRDKEKPKRPLDPALIQSDTTIEAFVKFIGRSTGAVGLFSNDAGVFLGGYSMKSDNKLYTYATLSKLWDGEPIDRSRVLDNSETYFSKRATCHFMIQPEAVDEVLTDKLAQGQGLLARFLVTDPVSRIGHRHVTNKPCDEVRVALGDFAARIKDHLSRPLRYKPNTDNDLELRTLKLSDKARSHLCDYYTEIEHKQAAGRIYETFTSYASKSVEQACRLAAVLTLFENREASEVNELAMARGITLARHYLGEQVRLCGGALIPKDLRRAELLRIWLRDVSATSTPRF